jgi:hypothetical protein
MSDVGKMVFASLTTIFTGALVFVLGQILQRFVFEPIQEQARAIGNIAHALLAFEHLDPISHKADDLEEASKNLRQLAAQLRAGLRLIPFYGFFELCRFVVHRQRVLGSIRALIAWSEAVYNGNTLALRQQVAEQLHIPVDEFERPWTDAADADSLDDLRDDDASDAEEPAYAAETALCKILSNTTSPRRNRAAA